MNQQPMNLQRSMQIMRRYKALIGIVTALGLLGGVGYAVLDPPTFSSQAVVVLPQPKLGIATQTLIAGSAPVLMGALPALGGETYETLQHKVSATNVTPNAIAFTAKDKTAALAEKEANAVAASYTSYVGSANSPSGRETVHVLVSATTAAGTSAAEDALLYGGIGVLAGLLIGFILAVRESRNDKRLRARVDIARAVGVPVLAAVRIEYPVSVAGWGRLLENVDERPGQSWQLRKVLDRLGITGPGKPRSYLSVVSLANDRKAAVLGPRLAIFAASLDIPTVLVIGPRQDADNVAELRAAYAACSASSGKHLDNLTIVDAHVADADWRHPAAGLTVVVLGVDEKAPLLPDAIRASTTLLGVSAGVVTAEQLAQAAMAAVDVGSRVAGILVANPEPGDDTTGLAPSRERQPQRGVPMRVNGVVTEIR
jgi:capsular polysaccharide biosynthesis protein